MLATYRVKSLENKMKNKFAMRHLFLFLRPFPFSLSQIARAVIKDNLLLNNN